MASKDDKIELEPSWYFMLAMEKFPVLPTSPLIDRPGVFAVVKHGWPVDITVDTFHIGVKGNRIPDEGHPRRCQALTKTTVPPSQCTGWALNKRIHCFRHQNHNQWYTPLQRKRDKLGFYDHISGTLMKKVLEDGRNTEPSRHYSIHDELTLARMANAAALMILEATLDEKTAGNFTPKQKIEAAELAQRTLDKVAEIALKGVKIQTLSSAVLDYEQLDYILSRVSMIIQKHLVGVDAEKRDQIIVDIQNIKLPPRRTNSGESVMEQAAKLQEMMKLMESGNIVPEPEQKESPF